MKDLYDFSEGLFTLGGYDNLRDNAGSPEKAEENVESSENAEQNL